MTDPSDSDGPWTDIGRRSTYCSPIAERFATTACADAGMRGPPGVERQVDTDAVRAQGECADATDRRAEIRDLGVGEDAPGVGEIGVHGVDPGADEVGRA